ncbi:hypothetical protein VNO77_34015 [Canavalia gladiata]|uniref:Uncharacterized protein n=1 Tax=Canavalia gladiata TaxID=3824 RepID=A0AAN9PYW9_CANGL
MQVFVFVLVPGRNYDRLYAVAPGGDTLVQSLRHDVWAYHNPDMVPQRSTSMGVRSKTTHHVKALAHALMDSAVSKRVDRIWIQRPLPYQVPQADLHTGLKTSEQA